MNAPAAPDSIQLPLSEARIPDEVFSRMRRENLARWPTGDDVDFDAAVARHQALPRYKQLGWVMREAVRQGRCLTQPRGGFGTFEMHRHLMVTIDKEGHATSCHDYDTTAQEHVPRAEGSQNPAGRRRCGRYPS